MFTPATSVPPTPVDKKAPALIATPELKSLYEKAKILFDYSDLLSTYYELLADTRYSRPG